jgi:hypothetical protein
MIEATQKIEVSDELIRVHAPGRIAALNRDEVDGKFVGKYAITIRMQDGSTRVITDAHPARWRQATRETHRWHGIAGRMKSAPFSTPPLTRMERKAMTSA